METSSGATRRIAVCMHMLGRQPYGEAIVKGLRDAVAGRSDLALEIVDGQGRAALQAQQIDAAVGAGVGAVIVAPIDTPSLRGPLRRARDRGIPVVNVDSDLGDPSLYDAQVLPDQPLIGKTAASFLVEAMGGWGELLLLKGPESFPSTRARTRALQGILAANPRLRLVEICTGDWLYDVAAAALRRALPRHPRLDAVCAQNDEMARAALDVAAELGREADLLVTGVDALPGELGIRLVSQGKLAASVLNPIYSREAIHVLDAIWNREPFQKTLLLKTSVLRSNERIKAWQARRRGR